MLFGVDIVNMEPSIAAKSMRNMISQDLYLCVTLPRALQFEPCGMSYNLHVYLLETDVSDCCNLHVRSMQAVGETMSSTPRSLNFEGRTLPDNARELMACTTMLCTLWMILWAF